MNPDFEEFLRALNEAGARFLVVGAHALAVHGVPRATGDIDIWIDPSAWHHPSPTGYLSLLAVTPNPTSVVTPVRCP